MGPKMCLAESMFIDHNTLWPILTQPFCTLHCCTYMNQNSRCAWRHRYSSCAQDLLLCPYYFRTINCHMEVLSHYHSKYPLARICKDFVKVFYFEIPFQSSTFFSLICLIVLSCPFLIFVTGNKIVDWKYFVVFFINKMYTWWFSGVLSTLGGKKM